MASLTIAKPLKLDPQLWSAHSELGINLMRLGQEDEPRKQLEMCYDNGYRNEETVNTPAPARQLQEFRHVQGRHHDPQAAKERSGPAPARILKTS